MIDEFLGGEDWDEPPSAMAFEAPYSEILNEVDSLETSLRAATESRKRLSGETAAEAVRLFVRVPALVNVMLNYKICVEHGLPLHPTIYYELAEARKYRLDRGIAELELANRLYRFSIGMARAAYRLDGSWAGMAAELRARMPSELGAFVYTGGLDRYTWRASEPAKLRRLADAVREGFSAQLLVAAAHGSIMPALLLAEILGLPLYFLRFSMFKRRDEAPIISLADEAWLSQWARGKALVYDEDVAKGTTLEAFSGRLAPFFAESRTACSIRHAGAGLRPDFAATTWWG
jgi:hypothetical protein